MNKSKKLSKAVEGVDYDIAPTSRRAQFKKNNQAALVHGGFSNHLGPELLAVITDNDLGFEVGVLKGQLSNLTMIGDFVIKELHQQGESVTALNVALSCADRASKLVPQIQRALESPLITGESLSQQKVKIKNRWLKKLQAGGCSAMEVAYQFEVNQLGSLPNYVVKKLEFELKNATVEIADELFSRQDINKMTEEYWNKVVSEPDEKEQRLKAIHIEKERVNNKFFTSDRGSENDSD